MRPLSLTIQNFRSFHHPVTIRFEDFLDEKDLFLITGDTGSGKSSILDAMTYALYGSIPKGVKMAELVSQYAENNEKMQIIFEFENHGHRYKVIRSRQKDKGMLEIHRDNQLVTAKQKEGTEYLKELLGLDMNQFTQVIVLPQESMSHFLSASAGEKEKVLRSLFDLEQLKKMHDVVKQHYNKSTQDIKRYQGMVTVILEQLHHEDDVEVEHLVGQYEYQKEKVNQHIENKQQQFKQHLSQLVASLSEKESQYKKTKEEKEQAKIINQAIDAYKKAEQEQQQLQDKSQSYQQAVIFKERMDYFNQHQLFNLFDYYQQQKESYDDTQQRYQNIRADYLHIDAQRKATEQTYDDDKLQYETTIKQYEQQLQVISREKEHRLEFKAIQKEQQQLQDILHHKEVERQQCQEEQQQRLEKQNRLAEIEQTLVELKEKVLSRQSYVSQLDQYRELEKKKQCEEHQLKQWQQRYDEKQKQKDKMTETLTEAYHLFVKSAAMKLAMQLEEGHPCPVCGSCQHPHPAKQTNVETIMTEQDLEQLRQQEQLLNHELQQLQGERDDIQQRLQQYQFSQVKLDLVQNGPVTKEQVEIAEEDLQCCKEQYNHMQEEQQKVSSWLKQHTLDEDSIGHLDNEIKTINNQLQQVTGQLITKEKQLLFDDDEQLKNEEQTIQKQLHEDEQHYQQLNEEWNMLNQKVTSLKAQMDTIYEDYMRCQTKMTKAKERWSNQLYLVQLTEEEFMSWRSKRDDYEEVSQFLNWYTLKKEQLEAELTKNKAIFQDKPYTDIHNIEVTLAKLEQDIEMLKKEKWQQQHDFAQWEERIQQLDQHMQCLIDYNHQKDYWHRLLKLWDNSSGNTSIERYVISHYFEQMVKNANIYLRHFSKQRYYLMKKSVNDLDLLVYDCETGQTRSVNTLSGGETFMCTLSLALGMSKVLSYNHGHISINALFIDEGFGKLDEEAIDEAIRLLNQLQQENNSLIGIITHIPAVQESVQKQLHVIKKEDGSHIKIIK